MGCAASAVRLEVPRSPQCCMHVRALWSSFAPRPEARLDVACRPSSQALGPSGCARAVWVLMANPSGTGGDNGPCRKCKGRKGDMFLSSVKPERPSTSMAEERKAKVAADTIKELQAKLQKLEKEKAALAEPPATEKKVEGDETFKASCVRCDKLAKELANMQANHGDDPDFEEATKVIKTSLEKARADRDAKKSPSAVLHGKQRAVDAAAKRTKQQEQMLTKAGAVLASAYRDVLEAEGRLQAAKVEERALQEDFKKYHIQCGTSEGDDLAIIGGMLGDSAVTRIAAENPTLRAKCAGFLDQAKELIREVKAAAAAQSAEEEAKKQEADAAAKNAANAMHVDTAAAGGEGLDPSSPKIPAPAAAGEGLGSSSPQTPAPAAAGSQRAGTDGDTAARPQGEAFKGATAQEFADMVAKVTGASLDADMLARCQQAAIAAGQDSKRQRCV